MVTKKIRIKAQYDPISRAKVGMCTLIRIGRIYYSLLLGLLIVGTFWKTIWHFFLGLGVHIFYPRESLVHNPMYENIHNSTDNNGKMLEITQMLVYLTMDG